MRSFVAFCCAAVFVLCQVALAAPASAGIYECRDATGRLSFQDKPCAQGAESRERVRPAATSGAQPARPGQPAPQRTKSVVRRQRGGAPIQLPDGATYVLDDSLTATTPWLEALQQARGNDRSGTLLRVWLEGAGPTETIQLAGTKLSIPTQRRGGGRYREAANGSFVFVDAHGGVVQRGHVTVELGHPQHGVTRLPVPMASAGVVTAGGDVVLARTPETQLGEVELTLPPEVGAQRVVLGPLVVGGPYGQPFDCTPALPCTLGPLAPGRYKLQFPELDARRSRFDVVVAAGMRSRLVFRAGGESKLTVVEQATSPASPGTSGR